MPTIKRKIFFDSEAGVALVKTLQEMVEDPAFNTEPTYSANCDKYPDNLIPFVDKHMDYLSSHPSVNPQYYIANLQLMTRVR